MGKSKEIPIEVRSQIIALYRGEWGIGERGVNPNKVITACSIRKLDKFFSPLARVCSMISSRRTVV